MKIFFVLIYVFISQSLLWAEDWSLIYSSKTHEQLQKSDRDFAKAEDLEKKCQFERKNSLFPRNCFVHIDQLLSQTQDLSQIKVLTAEINHLCVSEVEQLSQRKEIEVLLTSPLVNKKCLAVLKGRKEDVDYINES